LITSVVFTAPLLRFGIVPVVVVHVAPFGNPELQEIATLSGKPRFGPGIPVGVTVAA